MTADPLEYVDPGTAFSLAGLLYLLMAIIAGIHVVLNKQNEAAAFSWLGIIVLAPLVGALLYWLFGINRIQRRAQAELSDHGLSATETHSASSVNLNAVPDRWQQLMRLGQGVHQAPYLAGNTLTPLINGDQAYPEMLEAIANARQSVVLSSYIFEYDDIGKQFVTALIAAHERGVAVRVMIDGLGVGYGFSLVRADRVLRAQGVKTARFLSTWSTAGTRFINLRNHRKILSVDGQLAFVGGLNIRQSNLVLGDFPDKTQDVQFRVQGPVIDQINAVFAADWLFAAGEKLSLPAWQSTDSENTASQKRTVTCRVLLDGPDDNYQKLQLTMLGAIQTAQHRVLIVSPYFLPGKTVISALHLAVLRGVKVELCIPAKNNLRIVGWAMDANREHLIEQGVRVYESPEPFDHSKLFLIDDMWCLIGSSNWDARSLELNFEINLECYDTLLTARIAEIIERKIEQAGPAAVKVNRHLLERLRNNFFRLFSPYL
ncbi:MAG: phospholipase D-like domain-containing protein [Granulosicoccus sp.]